MVGSCCLISDLCFSAWDIFLAHEAWGIRHLSDFSLGLHGVHETDIWVIAKHIVKGMFTID